MVLKKFKPTTSGQRHLRLVDTSHLTKIKPLKTKLKGLVKTGGRNNYGRITAFSKGGGHKRRYRLIDLKRPLDSQGVVVSLEYDPNRTAHIARIFNKKNQKHFYITAPRNLKIGHLINSGPDIEIKMGNALPLYAIPAGTLIHNISVKSNGIAQYARSAGSFGQLIKKTNKYARIQLKSKEHRLVPINCYATIGTVSNEDHKTISLGKAGRSRWLNKRSSVRGVAMNPIDHPHGGGEGKTSGGRPSVTPWGKPTKGQPTSKSKNKLILESRKNRKKQFKK
jgi:large subunit ribosomal protein L2